MSHPLCVQGGEGVQRAYFIYVDLSETYGASVVLQNGPDFLLSMTQHVAESIIHYPMQASQHVT